MPPNLGGIFWKKNKNNRFVYGDHGASALIKSVESNNYKNTVIIIMNSKERWRKMTLKITFHTETYLRIGDGLKYNRKFQTQITQVRCRRLFYFICPLPVVDYCRFAVDILPSTSPTRRAIAPLSRSLEKMQYHWHHLIKRYPWLMDTERDIYKKFIFGRLMIGTSRWWKLSATTPSGWK